MSNSRPFLLRLPTSLREQATELAKAEGVSLNYFISLSVSDSIVKLAQSKERKAAATPTVSPMRHFLRTG